MCHFSKMTINIELYTAYIRDECQFIFHNSDFFFQTLLLQIWQRLNSAARSRVHPPDNNLSCDNGPPALRGGELAHCDDDYDGNDQQIVPEKLPPLMITFHMILVVDVIRIFSFQKYFLL